MLFPFIVSPLKLPYSLPPPILPNPPTTIPDPGLPLHWGIGPSQDPAPASPPIDDWLGYPLQHIHLEPQVLPGVFFDWGFSSKELLGYWLVHIDVPPMGLQTPSGPWALSLAPSLGTLCTIQWMTVSIHFCICQELAEPLRRQHYQAPVSKHLLASAIVSGFGGCLWDGSPGGAVSGWSFLQSLLWTLSL